MVAVAALLAGCGSRTAPSSLAGSGNGPAASSGVSAGSPSGQATTQARQLLARYEKSIATTTPGAIGITSQLVDQVGNWEPTVGGNNKMALLTGHVREQAMSGTVAHRSTVQWADGRQMPVQTTTMRQALQTVHDEGHGQSCNGCTPVTLGDPRLTRIVVHTTTGNATVPAWSFAVRGSRVRATVVAIDTADIVPALPQLSGLSGPFVSFDSAHVRAPRTLTVSFVGVPGAGRVICGADYAATAVESRHAVAVLIQVFPHRGSADESCSAVGQLRTATVQLTAPLAGRAVLDVVHGQAGPLH